MTRSGAPLTSFPLFTYIHIERCSYELGERSRRAKARLDGMREEAVDVRGWMAGVYT